MDWGICTRKLKNPYLEGTQNQELNLSKVRKKCKFARGSISINHCINLFCCFQYKHMQSLYKKVRVLLFFLMKTVDSVSLCPNVFHKVEIVLMYMELNETVKTRRRLSLYFPIKGVDPISLCPIVFPKADKVLIYMELYQAIRAPQRFLYTLNYT